MDDLLITHWPVVVFVAVIVAILALARLLLGSEPPPYEKRNSLLTESELAFFRSLQEAAGGNWGIFAMVRLADLIQVRSQTPKPQPWRNRIHAKHIDFVLCDHGTMEAKLAIELDDRSHDRPDRIRRDQFVEDALAAASLPLLRVKVAESYDSDRLRRSIRERVK